MRYKSESKLNRLVKLALIGLSIFFLLIAFVYGVFAYGYALGMNDCRGERGRCGGITSPVTFTKKDLRTTAQKIEDKIKSLWKAEAAVAKAVFRAESGLRPKAIGRNCIYEGKSTWCRGGDESLAWSVDCGVAMLNHRGQTCPAEYMDWEKNLERAHEMWTRRGWTPWVAYWKGYYKKFMPKDLASL